jgi:ABC-2 type transport system ATP-binding protein
MSLSMIIESADCALEMENLVKRYGNHEAVRGLTLDIRRGEFFGLLGPNGAGKTTTLEMLSGLIEPSEGRIRINGQPAKPRTAELKRKLGLVPQNFAFYPTLSALDNLTFFGSIFGLRGRTLRERIKTVLNIARLADREREPVGQFSGGMKRRLNIAIGLLHEPEILVLDEPTVGVDAQSRNAILDTLQELNRDGLTVVYSTHYMEEAQRLCGRVAIMDQGRIVALDSPRELVRSLAQGLAEIEFAEPLREGLLARLREIATIKLEEEEATRILLEVPRPEQILPPLFEIAREGGIAVRNLRLLEPGLETVFLKLTGRQLRD